jgi:ABC-type nitrate/sulfonate/bicarbonate transport system substrate-binding protein
MNKIGLAVALALSTWLCAAIAAEKVRALIPVKNIDESLAPFVVAKYLAYYEQEGLDVDLLASEARMKSPFKSPPAMPSLVERRRLRR